MTLQITPPCRTIRTDLFTTRDREATRGILVRYSNTINDPRIDAAVLDEWDCDRGFFGCASHYVIRTDGRIETGRGPRTIASIAPPHLAPDHIVVSIVGGLDLDGTLIANDTDEQEATLEVLLQAITDALDKPLEITDQRAYLRNLAYREYLAAVGDDHDTDTEDDNDGG